MFGAVLLITIKPLPSFGSEKLESPSAVLEQDGAPELLENKPDLSKTILNKDHGHKLDKSVPKQGAKVENVCFKNSHRRQTFYADGALRGPHITPMEYLISKHQRHNQIGKVFSLEEQGCLTTAIYHEARGETLEGQIAVAQVIINRVLNADFPNSICGVVYQRKKICQFSFACDATKKRSIQQESWDQAQMIVTNFMRGNIWLSDIANATYFHTQSVSPAWRKSFCRLKQVGSHVFYKTPDAFRLRYSQDRNF